MLHTQLSPEAGTTGQLLADVPSGLSLTPPQEIKKNSYCYLLAYLTTLNMCTGSNDRLATNGNDVEGKAAT
jgi:hypothetical protein